MKPHEILQKIIDEEGNCNWADDQGLNICKICPMSRASSCMKFVDTRVGGTTDEDYLEVARKLLADLEADRIILGEKNEE